MVARNALHTPAQKLLEEERLTAPAQLVYTEAATEIVVWIGDLVRSQFVINVLT